MSRHFGNAAQRLLFSSADIRQCDRQVRVGPTADLSGASVLRAHDVV